MGKTLNVHGTFVTSLCRDVNVIKCSLNAADKAELLTVKHVYFTSIKFSLFE